MANLPKPDPTPVSGGAVPIPAGRQIAISNSSQLAAALEDLEKKNTDNVVLVLAPGTYELSEFYGIYGRQFSLYGNPQNPESVKIRFAEWMSFSFEEGSRGSVIGCDITGRIGIYLDGSGTDFTLLHCRF